jgi:hypothetical protein
VARPKFFNNLTIHKSWVPHPFAHFAKGWETTNLNQFFLIFRFTDFLINDTCPLTSTCRLFLQELCRELGPVPSNYGREGERDEQEGKGESRVLGKSFPHSKGPPPPLCSVFGSFAFVRELMNETARFFPGFRAKTMLFGALCHHFRPFFICLSR